MTLQVILTRGIPGAGKSRWAKKQAQDSEWTRVCLDDLREMIGDYNDFSSARERIILDMQDDIILRSLKAGQNVIVDATHLNPKTPRRVATMCWEENLDVEYQIKDFSDVDPDECRTRDYARALTERSVGTEVMDRMIKSLNKAAAKWTVEDITAGLPVIEPYVPLAHKPVAFVTDIDGTLANGDHRSPYDHDKCGADGLHGHLAKVLDHLARSIHPGFDEPTIIACSGRDEKYREITEAWFARLKLPIDHLFMRPAGDIRRDSVIKVEMFNKYIRNDYNVIAWFDDRNRVVSVVRALGVPCYQVAPGAF
jgi:predicted kinase